MGRIFDEGTSMWVQNHFEKSGVTILTGTMLERFIEKNGRVVEVETKSGDRLEADFVAVGIGTSPNVDLAKNSGLRTDNGIWCNEYLQTSAPEIYAVGDVANFFSHVFKSIPGLSRLALVTRGGVFRWYRQGKYIRKNRRFASCGKI